MDDADEISSIEIVDPEMRQMLGMFDVPAFARRGQELEHAVRRLHERCRLVRAERLAMVHMRLRQWAAAVEGPDAWSGVFAEPIDRLWTATDAPPPAWGAAPASPRRRRAIARDLVASVDRFNRLWTRHLDGLHLEAVNTLIEHYNRYYLLEKECVFRSTRLAARLFTPKAPITIETLRAEYPPLGVPTLLQ